MLAFIHLPPNDPSIAPLRNLPHELFEGRGAAFAVGTVAQLGHCQVPGVAHPDDLDPELREDTEQILPPLPCAVVPSIGAALDR